jgi:hypothetical protein
VKRLLALFSAFLLLFAAGSALAQVGYVHALTGTATATAGSAQRPLAIGSAIETGMVVSTGAKSSATLKFEDGQIFVLSENSSFRVADYRYNKQRISESSAAFALLKGALRFITGVMGSTNHNSVRVSAGTATAGIRGTDVTLTLDAATQAVTAAVNAGLIALSTPQGTQNVGPGEFSESRPGVAPTAPTPLSQASPLIRAVATSLASQPVPLNTPVVVALSARAAAAAASAAAQPGNEALQREAQEALQSAIQAAESALKSATDAGAVPPAPPAPPPPPPPGDTGPGTTSTSTGATPTGGAGAGGGGGSTVGTSTSASPN